MSLICTNDCGQATESAYRCVEWAVYSWQQKVNWTLKIFILIFKLGLCNQQQTHNGRNNHSTAVSKQMNWYLNKLRKQFENGQPQASNFTLD